MFSKLFCRGSSIICRPYGGKPGFTYILTDLKAELLPYIGEENFHKMMVENPKRIFAWKYND